MTSCLSLSFSSSRFRRDPGWLRSATTRPTSHRRDTVVPVVWGQSACTPPTHPMGSSVRSFTSSTRFLGSDPTEVSSDEGSGTKRHPVSKDPGEEGCRSKSPLLTPGLPLSRILVPVYLLTTVSVRLRKGPTPRDRRRFGVTQCR